MGWKIRQIRERIKNRGIVMNNSSKVLVNIKNCNNITNCDMEINKNVLNIKYAMNGIGKSSISKAIKLFSEDKSLDDLIPLSKVGIPEVNVNDELTNVLVFDEDFVKNIVFKDDNVIENSFDVFIKTPDYDIRRNQLDERLKTLKVDIGNNLEVLDLLNQLKNINNKLGLNADNSIRRNPFFKSVLKRDNIHNIPHELSHFSSFMQGENNIEWIDWKSKGFNYDDKDICPFCTEKLNDNYEKEKEIFISTYDKKSTKDLIEMLELFTNLKDYIDEEKYEVLLNSIKNERDTAALSLQLSKVIQETVFINKKISEVIEFDSYNIRNEEISELDEKVRSLYIDVSLLDIFKSDKTLDILSIINKKIDEILLEVGSLKEEVGALNGYIFSAARQSKEDINSFLESAGINYEMDITVFNDNEAKTTLKYVCREGNCYDVTDIKKHLSWGEKNAFALVLFMHYSIQQDPDLIILDDPISSFDSNKKYAIINRLFKKNPKRNSFYNKTVMMLTHDFEPVIDFIINHKPTGGFVKAHYLKNCNGQVSETPIVDNADIVSLPNMLAKYSKDESLNIVHRVVFLRKLIELIPHENSQEAYDILSSLIHGKDMPDRKINDNEYKKLVQEEIDIGYEIIDLYISGFNYEDYLENHYTSDALLKAYDEESNNYLKLQIFRVYLELEDMRRKIKDDVVLKFVDNIYHVENDYMYCLDIFKYDIVPEHIINRIDSFMDGEIMANGIKLATNN